MIRKTIRLWRERATAIAQRDALSNRLAEFQIQVEVAALALEQKDLEMFKFVGCLHETMGGETRPMCETEALARLRVIRAQADKYLAIRDALAGSLDVDAVLLRRLACAMGTSQIDCEAVIGRANALAKVNVTNGELTRTIARMQAEMDRCAEEREDAYNPRILDGPE